jgi:hypothetical protein
MYEIAEYDKRYRPFNKSGGELVHADFVKLPVKPRGKGLQRLLKEKRSLEVFAVWCLLLEEATDAEPENRGKLLNNRNEPASISEIAEAISLGSKKTLVKYALSLLVSMGWVTASGQAELSGTYTPLNKDKLSKGKLSKEKVKHGIFFHFLECWNSHTNLPQARNTATRENKFHTRMKDQLFQEQWAQAVDALAASPFHTGKNDRGWKADIDWFLKNDTNYVKLLDRADMVQREKAAAARKRENLARKEREKKHEVLKTELAWTKDKDVAWLRDYLQTHPHHKAALYELRPELKENQK